MIGLAGNLRPLRWIPAAIGVTWIAWIRRIGRGRRRLSRLRDDRIAWIARPRWPGSWAIRSIRSGRASSIFAYRCWLFARRGKCTAWPAERRGWIGIENLLGRPPGSRPPRFGAGRSRSSSIRRKRLGARLGRSIRCKMSRRCLRSGQRRVARGTYFRIRANRCAAAWAASHR